MPSLKIFVLFGVVFGPTIIQGKYCPRTNKEAGKICATECAVFIGCPGVKDSNCICDGDCGYSCVKKGLRCPKTRRPTNGQRVMDGRYFNDTATFTCDPGYTLSGSSVRTCRGGRTWDGVEPKCGKKCDDPGVGNDTLRREPIRNSSGFLTSEVLHYYCNAGYLIEGKDIITCQAGGTWDSSRPQCYRTSCPPPTLPAYSNVYLPEWFNTSQGARNGRQIYLKCDPGYYKVGSSSIMACSGEQWQLPTSFKCSPVNCGDPGTPRDGGKNGLVYHFKSKVEFYCNQCYKLIGAAYRYCNADQAWSGQQPTCHRVRTRCKDISYIRNGWVRQTSTECGGTTKFSCYRYYNLIGSSQITCRDNGTWSATTPYCEPVTCPKFNASKGIHANFSGYQYGSTVKFSCKDPNSVLSGKSSSSCNENGEWSAKVPECLVVTSVVTCPKFNASNGIHANVSGYQYGSTVKFSCKDPNSVLFGKNSSSCNENGEWSAKVPECLVVTSVVTCPKLNASNGIHANVSGYQYGSTVKFSCKDPNSVLFGKNSSSCNKNGEWSVKVPECLGIISYSMPVGQTTLNGKMHYKDTPYNGVITNGFYKDGTGILTDGKFGPVDAKSLKGEGWVGWSSTNSQHIDIIFEFSGVLKFKNVTLTMNVDKKRSNAVFNRSQIFFASTKDGFSDTSFLQYTCCPRNFQAQDNPYNANVTLPLCENTARFIKLQLHFGAKWLLITEISFNSVLASGSEKTSLQECPYYLDKKTPTTSSSGSSNLQLIIIIICVILLIVIVFLVVIFLLYRRRGLCFKQQNKTKTNIHVELQNIETLQEPRYDNIDNNEGKPLYASVGGNDDDTIDECVKEY